MHWQSWASGLPRPVAARCTRWRNCSPLRDELVFIGDNGGAIRWKGQNLFTSEMSPEGWRALNRLTREQGDIAVLCGLESAYVERPFTVHDAVLRHFYTKIEYVDRLEDVTAPADKFTIYLHSTMRSRPTIRSMPVSGASTP